MLDIPERLGRYELLCPIGSGGMARVFLARTRGAGGFERDVAIKLLHPHLREIPEFVNGLLDEARIAASIRHPNVVQIHDVVEDGPLVYLVMDYVDGDTLSGMLRACRNRGERLAPEVGLKVLCEALAGLHAAHELEDKSGAPIGLVHRDFSPQNLLVGIDGLARLTDFGIVKAAGKVGHTRTGLVKGKVRYMSPEQARARAIDRRSDVWAAGVLGWELFAGRRLYSADDDAGMLLSIVSERPPRLSTAWPEVPPELDDAIASALEPDVEQRCQTAGELRKRLLLAWGKGLPDSGEVGAVVASLSEAKRRDRLAFISARAAELRGSRSAIEGTETLEMSTRAQAPVEEPEKPPGEATSVQTPPPMAAVAGEPPKRHRGPLIGAAVAGGAMILGLIGWAATRASSSDVETSTAEPAAASSESSAQVVVPVPSAAPSPAVADQIRVIADRPIARLRIGSRLVAFAPPEQDVTIRLTREELASRETVEATSGDGRKMKLEIDGTAEVIEIDFSSAVQRPRRPVYTGGVKAVAPTPKPSTSARVPLAPNPWAKQK